MKFSKLKEFRFGCKVTLGIIFAFLCGNSTAQTSLEAEQGKLIRSPEAVGKLGPTLFGDNINIHTGGIEFRQEDVSIPGNNKLKVAVGRRLVIGSYNEGAGLFQHWDLDIPRIYGIFSRDGWTRPPGATATNQRCTNFGAPPEILKYPPSTNVRWRPFEFWSGNKLYIPGEGEQPILKKDAAYSKVATNDTYNLVTKNFWSIRCIPLVSSPYTGIENEKGEGFLAVSPDGTTYKFNWLATRNLSTITKLVPGDRLFEDGGTAVTTPSSGIVEPDPDPELPPPTTDGEAGEMFTIPRMEVAIFPTEIIDKFNNTVTYTYDQVDRWKVLSIQSSDGTGNAVRKLSFTYLPGTRLVDTVTDGTRTWRYKYESTATSPQFLTRVTLPDNSYWDFSQLSGLIVAQLQYLPHPTDAPPDLGCDTEPPPPDNYPVTGSIKHPSGATGAFTLSPIQHARTSPRICYTDNPRGAARARYPRWYDLYSITNKTITGPGLTPMSWTTEYDTQYPGWKGETVAAPHRVFVKDPANRVTRYTFGSEYGTDEGLLKQVDVDFTGTDSFKRRTVYRYNYSFTQPIGTTEQDAGDDVMSTRHIPQDRKTITQDGVDFDWLVAASGDFDTYMQPKRIVRSSSLNYSRTDVISYKHFPTQWVINQLESVKDEETGKVSVSNTYVTSGPGVTNLQTVTNFGKLNATYSYNADGTLATHKDGRNQITAFSNYKRGIARTRSYANNTSESATVTDIGTISSHTNAVGFTSNYADDAMGRLTQINYPTGDTVAWGRTRILTYQSSDMANGIEAGHWRQQIDTGTGYEINYLDALWRPIFSEKYDSADIPNTLRVTRRTFDHDGNLTYESFPKRTFGQLGPGRHHEYDALGRPTVTGEESELGILYSGYSYEYGFKKVAATARQTYTTFSYQVFDEPVESAISQIDAPEGVRVVIPRDDFGKPTSITRSGDVSRGGDGRSLTRTYVYDVNERLCKTIEPETGATVQDYDNANNVAWRAVGYSGGTALSAVCDRASVPTNMRVAFGYDTRNRLESTTFSDGGPGISRTYTADGLPFTITSDGSVWTNTYNKRRLLENESLSYAQKTYNIQRKYNPNGSLSSLVYPDNEEVIFAPNALGEPSKIGSYATLIKYHPNGALASFTYGNQLTHVTTQNARGLPFESFEGGIINDKYAFDANANVSGITDQLSNVSSRSMTYDGLDRLKSVAAPALWGNAAYGYDSLDNLTSTKLDIGGTKRTTIHNIDYTDSNHTGTYRLISTVGDPGYNFVYEYDVQGNVKKRGAQPYVFDQANRMKSATGKATYRYDGLGRRISTVGTDGVNRIQVYAQNGPLLYSVPGTASPTKFVYLDTHVLAEVTGSVVTYNHTDALGSPVAQTNAAGAVLSRTRYEPYGYVAAGSPKTIGFTGHTNDNETGLIYMQQRYYDPLAGRFFSVDEVTTNGSTGAGFNRYSYANNNPYTNFDPDGRNPLLIAPIVGAVVGGAINAADQYLTTGTVRWGGLGGVIDAAGDGAMFGLLGGAAVGSRSAINAPQATPKPDFLVTPGGVAVRNSPAGVRESLDKAGIASKAVQNKTGTETGTVHNVPSMKMDVRVMDGGPDHPPRVITSRQGSSQGVNPADGKNFGNIPKDDQRARSHIEFK